MILSVTFILLFFLLCLKGLSPITHSLRSSSQIYEIQTYTIIVNSLLYLYNNTKNKQTKSSSKNPTLQTISRCVCVTMYFYHLAHNNFYKNAKHVLLKKHGCFIRVAELNYSKIELEERIVA